MGDSRNILETDNIELIAPIGWLGAFKPRLLRVRVPVGRPTKESVMNWKPGDRAEISGPEGGKHSYLNGSQCTILSLRAERPGEVTIASDELPYPYPNDRWGGWGIKVEYLRPIDDGHERSTWKESVWKPESLKEDAMN